MSWHRQAEWAREQKIPIECHIEVPLEALMNVDAYTPGDYHMFFDDPRTRTAITRDRPSSFVSKRGCESTGARVKDVSADALHAKAGATW